ncbi:MAG: putative low-affinity inorganic phosphate transporter [Gammaproteobacteria bacterium]|jgi:PiT family inorganic phosphate transporter|nr:putative low-affinity inorganic phosphate transporter [Gammaproteobacteria bacterium]
MVSILLCVIAAALIFDFINGFHDTANAIATVVSTQVLRLRSAVIMASFFNFVGALSGTAVATMIATGLADPAAVTQLVILCALLAACLWNLITWRLGLPSSSSHALIGALAGAVVAHAGWAAFYWHTLYDKVLIPLVLSPTLGFVLGFLLMVIFLWLFLPFNARAGTTLSKRLQLLSSAAMAFSHGSNDAQKSMGIIALALVVFHQSHFLPAWLIAPAHIIPRAVIIACATAMALGTLAGGKRIIKTMGQRIIKIIPLQGVAAETSAAITIFGASLLGIPVSTTHCINASIMGVGATKRLSAVRWGVAGNIVVAWILTLPCSGALAFLLYKLIGQ